MPVVCLNLKKIRDIAQCAEFLPTSRKFWVQTPAPDKADLETEKKKKTKNCDPSLQEVKMTKSKVILS